MKRLTFAASLVLAVAVPASAQAQLSHAQQMAYTKAYNHARDMLGVRAPGCRLVGPHATCHGRVTDSEVLTSTQTLYRMVAPAPAPVTYTAPAPAPAAATTASYSSTSSYSGSYSDVPGVPSSFAACVAMRESTNGAGSSNIYGIQSSAGYGSLAEQKQAFAQMYAARGTQPWSPYDGC